MSRKLFVKALKNLKFIVWEGSSAWSDHFNFNFGKNPEDNEKDISVIINYDEALSFRCTCLYHSVKNVEQSKICSYVGACLHFLQSRYVPKKMDYEVVSDKEIKVGTGGLK